MLRSRSWPLSTLSFSSLRASRSAFVSRRGSRTGSRSGLLLLLPMPRNDKSCLLPLPLLALYNPTPLPDLSCDDPLGPDEPPVGEVDEAWALGRRTWPLEGGCDSLP